MKHVAKRSVTAWHGAPWCWQHHSCEGEKPETSFPNTCAAAEGNPSLFGWGMCSLGANKLFSGLFFKGLITIGPGAVKKKKKSQAWGPLNPTPSSSQSRFYYTLVHFIHMHTYQYYQNWVVFFCFNQQRKLYLVTCLSSLEMLTLKRYILCSPAQKWNKNDFFFFLLNAETIRDNVGFAALFSDFILCKLHTKFNNFGF